MDLDLFARQIQDAHGRMHNLLREVGGTPPKLEQTLEITFAELNTTFEELRAAEEELLTQQQELLTQQQAIQEERRRYQDLFEFAPDGYLITDQKGLIQEANRAAAALLNIDQQRLPGLPLTFFVVQDDASTMLNHLSRLRHAQPGDLLESDLRIKPRHAEPYDAWARVAPIFDRSGHVLGMRWLLRDITARKQAEAERLELRALLDTADQMIILIGPDYTIQAFNRFAAEQARSVFGREMATGQSMLSYVPPDECDRFKLHVQQALAGSGVSLEKPLGGPKGADWWEFHYYPILLPGDQRLGVHFMARNITERKQTEHRLRESEARLRLAMEAAQMGHWDLNILSGEVVGSWERNQILGLSSNQIHGSYEQFITSLHPDDHERVVQALKQAQAEHTPYQAEFRVIWPDGSIHWLVGDGRAYYDEDGRAVRMLGVIRDITVRKQAQAELQIAEERLHTVVANAPVILWALDRAGTFTLSEGKGLDTLGLQPGEVVGRSVYDVYAHEPSLLDTIGRAFAGQVQSWVQHVDGLLFDVQITPLRDQHGAIIGIIGVSTDITERKRAEQALHLLAEASALLSASLDYKTTLALAARLAVPALADLCVVCVQEADGQTQQIEVALADSSQAADLDTVNQLVGDGWSALMAEAVQRKEAILLPDLSAASPAIRPPDSERRQLIQRLDIRSLMVVPLQVREQTIGALMFGALHTRSRYDQTDLAFAKELAYRVAFAVDNARLYREAQAAIEARDTFLSIASHELKTPLTSMIGYTYLLQHTPKEGQRSPERIRQAVDVIARQSQRLNRLIEELLDLSRIQRGQWSLVLQPFDLVPLLDRVIEEARLITQEHSITLHCDDDDLIVNGDEGRVEQVIHNLLSNAVKYSPYGSPILVRVARHDRAVRISVTDKGIGVPQAAQARLWESFYRAGNVGKHSSGFGIGLYITHEIVQRHGGTIEVQSVEGRGSTFTVTLPGCPDAI